METQESVATLTTKTETRAFGSRELVTCVLDEVEFGMDINAIQEIVRFPSITPVPKASDYVQGLANLRGNILPIIDPRLRFGLEAKDHDDNCRVIVLELNGTPTGLIVDAVREVMTVDEGQIELPPPAIQGVDSKFLSGVAKLDDGERLVMLIDEDTVIDLEQFDLESAQQSVRGQSRIERSSNAGESEIDSEQLVTFRLADEEYAFSIMDVKEIIRVPAITQVPNAPPGVEGIASLRNRVLPVINLRRRFGFETLSAEMDAIATKLREFQRQQLLFFQELGTGVAEGNKQLSIGFESSEFMRWLQPFGSTDPYVYALLSPLAQQYENFNQIAQACLKELSRGEPAKAEQIFEGQVAQAHAEWRALFDRLFPALTRREDERCLVVGTDKRSFAFRIDSVNEVLQVSRQAIEDTPEIALGQGASRDQIRGVARLADGKRLIMLLEASKLVSLADAAAAVGLKDTRAASGSSEELDASTSQDGGDTVAVGVADVDDRQFVSFRVGEEEFASDIMQVKEIIRLGKVTRIPNAPVFVEGVVNLRGDVLPLIDLRCRFGMESRLHDDTTRVIVVDINNRTTGIIVDAVSEVISFTPDAIEAAPTIVRRGIGEEVVEGIGKFDGGDRMVLLLRTDQLLSAEELSVFENVSIQDDEICQAEA